MTIEHDANIDPATAQALRLFAERISAKYDVLDLMLFGSRARGDHARDSDADVAVLRRGDHQRLLPTELATADEAFDVLLETGMRIQPHLGRRVGGPGSLHQSQATEEHRPRGSAVGDLAIF
jgi:predicted nucleotidyltransferase